MAISFCCWFQKCAPFGIYSQTTSSLITSATKPAFILTLLLFLVVGDDQCTRRRSNDSRRAFFQCSAVQVSDPGYHQTHPGALANHVASSPVPSPRRDVLAAPKNVGVVFAVCKTRSLYQLQASF